MSKVEVWSYVSVECQLHRTQLKTEILSTTQKLNLNTRGQDTRIILHMVMFHFYGVEYQAEGVAREISWHLDNWKKSWFEVGPQIFAISQVNTVHLLLVLNICRWYQRAGLPNIWINWKDMGFFNHHTIIRVCASQALLIFDWLCWVKWSRSLVSVWSFQYALFCDVPPWNPQYR